MSTVTAPTREQVTEALGTVLDPCSVFNGTRLSLVDLGMVDEVTVSEDGAVAIRLFLDDPTCIFFFEIHRMLQEAVREIEGVTDVSVELKADEWWTEDRMTADARARLEGIRSARRESTATGWPLPMIDDPQPAGCGAPGQCGTHATGS